MIRTEKKIKGEFTRKRFPKKSNEKKSHEPIDVVRVLVSIFKERELEDELIPIKSTEEII